MRFGNWIVVWMRKMEESDEAKYLYKAELEGDEGSRFFFCVLHCSSTCYNIRGSKPMPYEAQTYACEKESHELFYESYISETEFENGGGEDFEVIAEDLISDDKEENEVIVIDNDDDGADVAPVREKEVIDLTSDKDDVFSFSLSPGEDGGG
ncbi:hypothetical protein DM860_003868 [Cuscuta australis]|uniref:Uncharacterized protein n=1 Tax=Cuscuta australis TaxID=267555 RepID=A0A328CVI5_9ASTE|nr:hypothetical protein DM860_003868 [Cuscuta australis]